MSHVLDNHKFYLRRETHYVTCKNRPSPEAPNFYTFKNRLSQHSPFKGGLKGRKPLLTTKLERGEGGHDTHNTTQQQQQTFGIRRPLCGGLLPAAVFADALSHMR